MNTVIVILRRRATESERNPDFLQNSTTSRMFTIKEGLFLHKNCCRVCTSRRTGMMSIFEHYKYSERNLQIFELITKCASVQITKLDGLSEHICKECMEHLCKAFSFKQLCEDSDYKFRHNLVIDYKFEPQNVCYNQVIKIQCAEDNGNETNEELLGSANVANSEIKIEFYPEDTKIEYGLLENQLEDEKSFITSLNLYNDLTSSPQSTEFDNSLRSCDGASPTPGTEFITQMDNEHMCEFCGECFSDKTILNNHKEIHTEYEISDNATLITDSAEKPYKCELCNKRFKDKGKLIVHNRIHTGEMPFKCEICGKHFRHKTAFLYHKKIHAGDKPYKCEICSKHFINHWALSRHNRIHTGEKPYRCETCGTCFNEISKLSVHKRIHTGEKPYPCEICSKYFMRRSALNRHNKTHTGEKPYKCEKCGKCFKERSTLNIHTRIHTGEKPFKCEICSKSFTQPNALISHTKTHTSANLRYMQQMLV